MSMPLFATEDQRLALEVDSQEQDEFIDDMVQSGIGTIDQFITSQTSMIE